jgi:site-specific DNA-methyltransferase (adenine-specific)
MIELHLGDCRDVLRQLHRRGIKADLLLTDPPYNISNETGIITRRGGKLGNTTDIAPKFEFDHKIEPEDWIPLASKVLKKDAVAVIFLSLQQVPAVLESLKKEGFDKVRVSAWIKPNPTPQARKRKWCTGLELFIIATRGEKYHYNWREGQHPGYIIAPPVKGKKRVHETQKPEKVMNDIVRWWSFSGDLVLDPFMGSGSSGVAAVKHGRNFIGIEINPRYYEIAKKRIPVHIPLDVFMKKPAKTTVPDSFLNRWVYKRR